MILPDCFARIFQLASIPSWTYPEILLDQSSAKQIVEEVTKLHKERDVLKDTVDKAHAELDKHLGIDKRDENCNALLDRVKKLLKQLENQADIIRNNSPFEPSSEWVQKLRDENADLQRDRDRWLTLARDRYDDLQKEKEFSRQQHADAEKYWEIMCDTAEALGKIVPEAAPHIVGWARKLKTEHTGQGGVICGLIAQRDELKADLVRARVYLCAHSPAHMEAMRVERDSAQIALCLVRTELDKSPYGHGTPAERVACALQHIKAKDSYIHDQGEQLYKIKTRAESLETDLQRAREANGVFVAAMKINDPVLQSVQKDVIARQKIDIDYLNETLRKRNNTIAKFHDGLDRLRGL